MKRLVVLLGLLMGLGAGCGALCWANATAVSADDEVAIQAVVQLQLDAFAEDDAASAFALATSATRVRFGSPDNFMDMVKEHYHPIYRNRLALFSGPEIIEGHTLQIVRLTDRESHVWLAVYRMQQDTDGSWKIDGCQLFETASVSI